MFSLIVVIIAITLVSLLSLASLYLSTDIFESSKLKVEHTTILAASSQIGSAMEMYRADHGMLPNSMDALTQDSKYLSGNPSGLWEISEAGFMVTLPSSDASCIEINKTFGIKDASGNYLTAIPTCDDSVLDGHSKYCCDAL